MTLLNDDLNARIAFLVGVLVGAIGAIGQAVVMHNTLYHSYPFKMMSVPPFTLYGWIGEVGLYVAPTFAIVITLCCRSVRQFLIPVIPVIICPLVYWFIFEITFAFSSYDQAAMRESNFDDYTGETARYYFGFEVGGLALWGTVIGAAAGVAIAAVSSFFAKRKSIEHFD